ncbi:MAG: hypothetical protein A2655_00860 [Candidatus Yanofskybacteria bacterium RIFCSPHIGHO2_01_FULL_43_42]|uniref:Uncharacterized protein n=1 Tax=Candidatus Taylorbacteria bacterium RIFCSPLOWO2_01_FULL_45_15b TaxID=1802319 RepID=A0A1G2NC42_9BACT|nr:MAG: hypothetical protein A2655_00860 [Candidatus Yanofskybacteria bacterium RIFCSPHIGHO2_01_FULL_43_42]OHA33654.1 MAG: hypothetical protein A2928_01740 [Candidatus Taylorbacteria bacterium RIFCSPLOWO2_01_FULL_45_15b]
MGKFNKKDANMKFPQIPWQSLQKHWNRIIPPDHFLRKKRCIKIIQWTLVWYLVISFIMLAIMELFTERNFQ